MSRPIVIHYHHVPIREWIKHHEWLVVAALGLVLGVLLVSIAVTTQSVVTTTIAHNSVAAARAAAAVPKIDLPAEWRYTGPEPVSFDHMVRRPPMRAVDPNVYLMDLSMPFYSSRAD